MRKSFHRSIPSHEPAAAHGRLVGHHLSQPSSPSLFTNTSSHWSFSTLDMRHCLVCAGTCEDALFSGVLTKAKVPLTNACTVSRVIQLFGQVPMQLKARHVLDLLGLYRKTLGSRDKPKEPDQGNPLHLLWLFRQYLMFHSLLCRS